MWVASSLSAPVTEIATFYFDGAPPDDAFESAKKCIEIIGKDAGENVLGWSYGITHEDIEKDGVKGKGAVLTVGWESKEAHMRARETQAFKDNIHMLRQTSKAVEMHHTRFLNFVAG